MRLQSASASSMECVVRIAARLAMVSRITSHSMRREPGSKPVLGSSRRHTAGELMTDMATLSLRCVPPLSSVVLKSRYSAIPRSRMESSARAVAAAAEYPCRGYRVWSRLRYRHNYKITSRRMYHPVARAHCRVSSRAQQASPTRKLTLQHYRAAL